MVSDLRIFPRIFALISTMAPPGRPDFRRKSNEIVDLYRRMPKSELPSDDELEFRRRLCEIVWKVNGMKPAVLTTCRTLYFHEYNQTELFDDATKAFGLKCEDGNSLMKHMDAQQIGEFSIGTPRLGQFYFYLHFNLNVVDRLHKNIRKIRDGR
ncbi:hypothetical protein M3Y98_01210900 [Aphelenchoides besseyi]|nr:hypothetical protein M3Y98_01210900 [Aphelenchoides besseyi]